MRPVRILLVVLALVAVGLAGWALGNRDTYRQPAAEATATTSAPAQAVTTPAPAPADDPATPAIQGQAPSATGKPSGGTAPPATDSPRPRIFGFGSEPVYPQKGGVWQLPPGPGEAVLVTDAQHATKVEFLLTPARGDFDDLVLPIGTDSNGRDGYTAHWRYEDRLLKANLTIRATGPGGTSEKVVGVYHPDAEAQP